MLGSWSSLAMIRGLGLRDPGSNPGDPIFGFGVMDRFDKMEKNKDGS